MRSIKEDVTCASRLPLLPMRTGSMSLRRPSGFNELCRLNQDTPRPGAKAESRGRLEGIAILRARLTQRRLRSTSLRQLQVIDFKGH
ncbi:hypothetical protein [Reyranella sp.]|uniref:hypothetical protein n=1 Tax=Reyranella sp. TaxID=1929291 RepID=UPI003784AE6A